MQIDGLRLRPVSALFFLCFLTLTFRASTASAATRILTDFDKGAKIALYDGGQIELRLTSNPSTGYMWYVHPQSTPLLKLVSDSETQSKEPGVGRPIVQIFRFQAIERGDGVLLLHYVRSGDKPDPNEQQFDLRVTIE